MPTPGCPGDAALELTARKQVEDRLAAAQVVGEIGIFDWEIDIDRVYWSPEVYRLMGLAPGAIAPSSSAWRAAVVEADREGSSQAFQDAVAARRERFEVEIRLRQPDGGTRWVRSSSQISYDERGTAVRMLGTIVDIEVLKRAVEAREAERQQLLRLLEQVPAVVNFVRGPDLVVELAHPTWMAQLAGRDPVGKPLLETAPELHDQRQYARLRRVYATGVADVQREVQRWTEVDGRRVDTYWDSAHVPVRDAAGRIEGVMMFDVDVTPSVEARRELEQARAEAARVSAQLRDLIMQSPIAMAVCTGPEHRYALANRRYHDMVARDHLVGRTIREVFPELVGSPGLATLDHTYGTGQPFSTDEYPVSLVRHGRLEDCFFQFTLTPIRDADGAITGLMVTAVEVTEQVRARRAVEHSEAKFRRMFEANMVGFLFGTVDGGVLDANDYVLELLGVSRNDLPALDLMAITVPDDVPKSLVASAEIRDRGVCEPFEKRYVRRDGTIVSVVIASALLPGATDRTITFMLDISERKRFEEQLAALRSEAETASRAKDEFLALLSHELRNPLAPILTALQLMKLRGADAVERERVVIERQAHHLVRLVDDLLDVSRITRGKIELHREPVELAEVIAKAIEMASPLIEQRRHELDVAVAQHGLRISVDPARFAQVISNVLINAAKYTEKGGQIAIAAMRVGPCVELAVRDTGMGIDADMLPRVFDLFVQERQALDRSQGGLGLGLSIVKSLVELHGGTVRADSLGRSRGTTITIRVPALAETPAVEGAAGAAVRQPAGNGHTVLVVDDNQDAAATLADLLEAMGYSTRVAHDGPDALRVAEEFDPELALLDIGLPVMDGYELAQRLRKRAGGRPHWLIAVTGYGQESDKQRAREASFDAHMVKPVKVDQLQGVIRGLLARPPPSR
jgi:PAS domain S-box-containing protein